MSNLDAVLHEIESRPGAQQRISAEVERMNRVLELEKLGKRGRLSSSPSPAGSGCDSPACPSSGTPVPPSRSAS